MRLLEGRAKARVAARVEARVKARNDVRVGHKMRLGLRFRLRVGVHLEESTAPVTMLSEAGGSVRKAWEAVTWEG